VRRLPLASYRLPSCPCCQPCCSASFSPIVHQSYPVAEALQYSVLWFGCGKAIFSLAFLLSSVISGEYTAAAASFTSLFGYTLAASSPPLRPYRLNIFFMMNGVEWIHVGLAPAYRFAGHLPWARLFMINVISLALLAIDYSKTGLLEGRDVKEDEMQAIPYLTKPTDRKKVSRCSPNQAFTGAVTLALVIAFAALPLLTVVRGQAPPTLKAPFAKPSGSFAVGTHEYLWIDQKREETFTKDPSDKRHLLARVWYPAGATPGKDPSLYVLDPKEFPENSAGPFKQGTTTKTNSVTDAPIAAGKSRFPVLVYQPGGGAPRFMGTFEAEQLASHGYVVVAADHAGFSPTETFPDGYRFKADQHLPPPLTSDLTQDYVNKVDAWLGNEVFPTWIADASYTLDKIEEMERTPGQLFYNRLDLQRIGMMGWSFGGATSIQMSRNDPRVKAVIDQDGILFGDVSEKGTNRPFMLMHHGGEDKPPKPEQVNIIKERTEKAKAIDRSLIDHSSGPWYDVTIANTNHGHFSDFLLFMSGQVANAELDPHRAHEIIVAYTLAFFDKYLVGKDSDLLKGPSANYPEVTFRKKQ
jgi:predicted dienelactone hydrolase